MRRYPFASPELGEADLRLRKSVGGTIDKLITAARNPTGLGVRFTPPSPASPYR